jgi:YesN/AraC family two-component response regulator
MSDQAKPKTSAEKAKEQVKPKEYSFSAQERDLLQNQENLKSQYQYMFSLIERDMYIFIHSEVKRRLGIGNDMLITWDLAKGKVYATSKPEPQDTKNDKLNSN